MPEIRFLHCPGGTRILVAQLDLRRPEQDSLQGKMARTPAITMPSGFPLERIPMRETPDREIWYTGIRIQNSRHRR